MTQGRVVPWKNKSELEELKSWFYPKASDLGTINDFRRQAIERVKSYKLKGSQYLPHVIDSTAQLTSAMLADEDMRNKNDELHNVISMQMTYTMILIRFVNGLLDPSQQTQFAIPLFTIARRVGLPSWFVDLRHWGTHERDLPNIDMLRMAVNEAHAWLWDNYWNNDELDEDDEEEDSDEAKQRSIDEQRIDDLKKLIRNWKSKENEMEEFSYIWMQDGRTVITSRNFTIDENNSRNASEVNSIPALIEKYTTLFKVLWKGIKDHFAFIRIVVEEYDKLLFEFLLHKLPNFDVEILSWILGATDRIYIEQGKEQFNDVLLLTSKFSKWKILETTLLHGIVTGINYKQRIEDIKSCLDTEVPLTYPRIRLYYLLAENIQSELSNNNWRKKRRRKDGSESSKNLMDISTEWKALSKNYILSHDILEEEKKYNMWKRIKQTTTSNDKVNAQNEAFDNTMNSDLKQLRDRLQKLKQKKQKIDNLELKTYNWEQHTDWEPKPIGTL